MTHIDITLKKHQAITIVPVKNYLNSSTDNNNLKYITALQLELSTLGYTLNEEVIDNLFSLNETLLLTYIKDILSSFRDMLGSKISNIEPLFKNFPKESFNTLYNPVLSEIDYFNDFFIEPSLPNSILMNRIIKIVTSKLSDKDKELTFLTNGTLVYKDSLRNSDIPLSDKTPLKIISFIPYFKDNVSLFDNLFESIMTYKGSISVEDREIASYIYHSDLLTKSVLHYDISFKEQSSLLASFIINKENNLNYADNKLYLYNYVKTATDIYRVAVALSQGDVSLKEHTIFTLKTYHRRVLITMINTLSLSEDTILEDMLRYRTGWLLLLKHIHISDVKYNKYDKAQRYAFKLRNNYKDIKTFNSKVEKLIIESGLYKINSQKREDNKNKKLNTLNYLKDLIKNKKNLFNKLKYKNDSIEEDYDLYQDPEYTTPVNSIKQTIIDAVNNTDNHDEYVEEVASEYDSLELEDTLLKISSDILELEEKYERLISLDSETDIFENKYNENKYNELITLLSTRMGEFSRRLDFILRRTETLNSDKISYLLDVFAKNISNVSTPMLLQLRKYFKHRTELSNFRYFIPKGNISKILITSDNREVISKNSLKSLNKIFKTELKRRYSTVSIIDDKYSSIYIDKSLKEILIPFVNRNNSTDLLNINRGSHYKIETDIKKSKRIIRLFTYWKETKTSGSVDVDLSAISFDTDFNYNGHVSWTNLESSWAKHSGDITSAPKDGNGSVEYLDIDLNSIKYSKKDRFIAITLNSFTHQNFNEFECFAGVMIRDSKNINEEALFEAKTVKNKFDISGEVSNTIPFMYDTLTNKIIWIDSALPMNGRNMVENSTMNKGGIKEIATVFNNMINDKENIYQLYKYYAQANNLKIITKEKDIKKSTYKVSLEEGLNKDIINKFL